MRVPLDLLAFGAHPDDIEIGLGGCVALHAARGDAVGLCDLTRGEMGSNGTSAERHAEAQAAAEVLGARWRRNLELPDCGLALVSDQVRAVVAIIREAQPLAIAVTYHRDRHPDHVNAHALVTDAMFRAGLRRYDTGQPSWRAQWLVSYFLNDAADPSFLVDVSNVYPIKQRALDCHVTQFAPHAGDAVATRLTGVNFRRLIESRDAQFGARIGVAYAEGLVVTEPLVRDGLLRYGT